MDSGLLADEKKFVSLIYRTILLQDTTRTWIGY